MSANDPINMPCMTDAPEESKPETDSETERFQDRYVQCPNCGYNVTVVLE